MKDYLNDGISFDYNNSKKKENRTVIDQTPVRRLFSLRRKFEKMPVYNLD